MLHTLPKEREAAPPFLAQLLVFPPACLQETTRQVLPLPEQYLHHSLSDPNFTCDYS